MNDVRKLLGRVAEDAGQPVISTEVVYARAARVRRRRRVAVSAAAVCAVAAGAFVVPGLSAGQEQAPRTSSVAAPGKLAGDSERARKLTALLPEDVGSVKEVPLAAIIKHVPPGQVETKLYGPLDGQYAVRRDGGVGYLVVGLMDAEKVEKKLGDGPRETNLCKVQPGEPHRTDCVREELPDGRVLTVWSDSMDYGDGTPQWGPELVARLVLRDGGQLTVRDSTGFEADTALGPLLKTPPLTRAQLRTLTLSPELLPAK
ncbi:hypothetical protein ACGFZA_04340 [Streptomyces sp. NPDC048211]|uniref:hypothetical protein n=1 Tax=Streptomyces sp. NPDC048211 TaxID=3365516 RepID=UPI0037193171